MADQLKTNSFIDQLYESEIRGQESSRNKYYVLHLSELSIDPLYLEGADKLCREFRCCHEVYTNTLGIGTSSVAGKYGSVGCDLPLSGA